MLIIQPTAMLKSCWNGNIYPMLNVGFMLPFQHNFIIEGWINITYKCLCLPGWFHGVVVKALDFQSGDLSSIPAHSKNKILLTYNWLQ